MRYLRLGILIFTLLLTSCGKYTEIENNVVITACFVNKADAYCNYSFYISGIRGGREVETEDSASYDKVYTVIAKNFTDAVEQLKINGMYNIDLNHMSVYCGNRRYFDEVFVRDINGISDYISVMGLTYAAVMPDEYQSLIDCINSEYSSSPADFVENTLATGVSGMNTTLSELAMCASNSFYTAALPELQISETNKLPFISGISLFNIDHSAVSMTNTEAEIYISWRKRNPRYYNLYKIYKSAKNISVVLDDLSLKDIAAKYSLMNIDVLNLKYYSVKNFKTYTEYERYFNEYKLYNTEFECGEI